MESYNMYAFVSGFLHLAQDVILYNDFEIRSYFYNCLSLLGHLSSFQYLTFMNEAAMNTLVQIFFVNISFYFLLGKYLGELPAKHLIEVYYQKNC